MSEKCLNVVAVVVSYMKFQLVRAKNQPATYETYWTMSETTRDGLHKEVKSAEEQCILYIPILTCSHLVLTVCVRTVAKASIGRVLCEKHWIPLPVQTVGSCVLA